MGIGGIFLALSRQKELDLMSLQTKEKQEKMASKELGLIARLEAAEGPSRELDALIWAEQDNRYVTEVGNKILATSRGLPADQCLLGTIDPSEHSRHFDCDSVGHRPPLPTYTASLDAAVSLVPEGKSVDIKIGLTFGAAEIYETRGMKDWQLGFAEAPTPILALCIAALKAREAETIFL